MEAVTTRCAALLEPKPLPKKERRRHERHATARPCKVYLPATGRYAAARTIDLSAGGALLEVELPRALEPGEEVDVALVWRRDGVLAADSMVRSRVVRTRGGEEGRRVVAVEFSQALAAAA